MHITFSPAGKPVRCCNIHTTYAKTVHLFAAAKACHLERRELLLNHLDFRCAEEQGKRKNERNWQQDAQGGYDWGHKETEKKNIMQEMHC